jgi:hypothetical protein
MVYMRNACNIWAGIRDGKRPLGKPGHSQEDNIQKNLKEIGCKVAG